MTICQRISIFFHLDVIYGVDELVEQQTGGKLETRCPITGLTDRKAGEKAVKSNMKNLFTDVRDAGTGGGAGGAAAPVALYQEGQGGKRCPFNLKDCLGEIASCQKC